MDGLNEEAAILLDDEDINIANFDPEEVETANSGEEKVAELNKHFLDFLNLVVPTLHYPQPKSRGQLDVLDQTLIQTKLDIFMKLANQIQFLLLTPNQNDNDPNPSLANQALQQEIQALELELGEKQRLLEKYGEILNTWEQKFTRLSDKFAAFQ